MNAQDWEIVLNPFMYSRSVNSPLRRLWVIMARIANESRKERIKKYLSFRKTRTFDLEVFHCGVLRLVEVPLE